MKIIGGHDYYDGAGYGVDPSIIFVRNNFQISDKDWPFKDGLPRLYSRTRDRYLFKPGIVIFCGIRYPFVIVRRNDVSGMSFEKDLFFYSLKDLDNWKEKAAIRTKDRSHWIYEKPKTEWSNRYSLEKFFENVNSQRYLKHCIENHISTAIIIKEGYDKLIYTNVYNLKDYEFYKVKSAPEAHMELSNFIGGVLPFREEMVEISDKSKTLKAGFDLKQSFRHRGGKKPRRKKNGKNG